MASDSNDIARLTALELLEPEKLLSTEEKEKFVVDLSENPAMWVHVLSRMLMRPTPEVAISHREGPNKGMLAYVDGAYAVSTLAILASMGISSDFDIIQTDTSTDGVECLGKLTFSFWCNDAWHSTTRTQWGDCAINTGMDRGSAKKGAATDALKKCLSQFGWAMDVYTTPIEKYVPPSKEELGLQSLETLFTIGKNKGWTEAEVRAWVEKEAGSKPEDLIVKDLAAIKRRLSNWERASDLAQN